MNENFDDYTIDGLIKEFERHVMLFKEHPDQAHGFCISQALMVMCQEIEKIKKDLYGKADKAQSRLYEKPHSRCY